MTGHARRFAQLLPARNGRVIGVHPPIRHVRHNLSHDVGDDGKPDGGKLGGVVQEKAPSSAIQPVKPLRVLVVEDDAIIAMELEMILEDLGAEVVGIAMTAEDAVDLARLHQPTFVTMDINLKGARDGINAATEIYELFGIRSVFVSAYGNAETLASSQAARPVAWVKKPVDPGEIKAAIALFREG